MSAVLSPHGGFSLPQRGASPSPSGAFGVPVASASRYRSGGGANRGTGLAVVVLLHLLVGWLLASGLANKAVQLVRKPLEAVIITEPPAPLPPPKIEKIKEVRKLELPPPPAYVPPPDITPEVLPPTPVIQAVQAEPPVTRNTPMVIAPPPPPVAVEAPKPAVVKQEISVACPGYQAVLAQALEEAIDRVGINGTVQTLIKIRGSQVIDVATLSGPKEYFKYVQAAVKRMRCTAGGADEVQVALPVNFVR